MTLPEASIEAAKEYPPLPKWAKRGDLGGLAPSEVEKELHAYVDADRASRAKKISGEASRLAKALRNLLHARSDESMATLSLTTAENNFSEPQPEIEAHTKAMRATSKAEAEARAVLARFDGEYVG